MDESIVRRAAEDHGKALVQGDLKRAGSAWYAWNDDVKQMAGAIMPMMPNPVSGAEVIEVRRDGEQFVVTTLYSGQDKKTTVESRWEEREGSAKMVAANVSSVEE
ncbi:MAG TPA: hypothetical protein VE889_06695 [Actinomycetota bacterium]|nr:hypothetical protein [Actinomycetota bacterium]